MNEQEIKTYYYFLVDSEKLPKKFSGNWEKDKEQFTKVYGKGKRK